jgi:type II secretory pathway component GspD/PulD (secretin)
MNLVKRIGPAVGLILTGLLLTALTGWAAQADVVTSMQKNTSDTDISKKLITLDAQDASLPDVLRLLADASGLNIVTGFKKQKEAKNQQDNENITLHLKDVPVDQAIDMVVRSVGLSYEIVGSGILVGEADDLQKEVGLNSYVVNLQYADAQEVADMLQNFTKNITVDISGNRLVVITSPKIIAEIQEAVETIDKPAPQIVLDAKLIEVNVNDEELLGIDWSKLNSLTTIIAENNVGSRGEPVVVAESSTRLGQKPDQMPFQPIDIKDIGHFSRQLNAFDITLNYLMRNNRATMLANSSVTTMNNREAEIKVIDLVSYQFNAGGQTQQITVKQQEVGVILKILPKINSDGYITTTVVPEVSNITDWRGPNKDIPQVKKRTATTTVRVRDGESIIIAGLLDRKKTTVSNRVPILGDLPFIGFLFRSKDERVLNTDLVVQVTPHILAPEGDYHVEKPQVIKEIEDELLMERILSEKEAE